MQLMKNQETGLKSGVVGLLGAATLGVVMLSPAMTLYGNFGAAYVTAGKAAPLAFILALLATIPTATSYALVSRQYPDSGSAASWTTRAISTDMGRWVGWMVFLYYFTNFVIQPVTLGLFFNDFLTALGFHASGVATYAVGALLCCAIPAAIVYRGISPSTKGALGLLLFESAIVIALCVAAIFFNPGRAPLSAEGLLPSAAPGGFSGISHAMVFAMLSYCGFDVISTLAEEAKLPRKLIPQATFLSLLLFGVLIIGGIWALTYSDTPERIKALTDAGGMPITEIARKFWGRGAILVTATGISAALGIAIATAVGASRILFSMGRSRQTWAGFGALNERYRVPWNAMHAIFLGGLAGSVLTGFLVGPYNAYLWWGTTSTFFGMLTFVFVNLANLIFNRHRVLRSPKNFVLHGLLPVAGIAADLFILVRSFFLDLWAQGWATGKSVVLFDVACAAVAVVVVVGWRARPTVADGAEPAGSTA